MKPEISGFCFIFIKFLLWYEIYLNSYSKKIQYRDIIIEGARDILSSGLVYTTTVIQQHVFDCQYSVSNISRHKSYCHCGEYILQSHVVSNSGILRTPCIYCGYLVNLNDTPIVAQSNNTTFTE